MSWSSNDLSKCVNSCGKKEQVGVEWNRVRVKMGLGLRWGENRVRMARKGVGMGLG